MGWLYIVSVWVHVMAATAWVGSMLFFAAVAVPVMRAPEALPLLRIVGRRYRVFGWIALGTLLVTGVSNLYFRGIRWALLTDRAFWSTEFGHALAWKLVFVGLVVGATLAHDAWRSALLGRATLLLSLVVLFFAVQLVRGGP